MQLDRKGLAAKYNVTARTVDRWAQAGCPHYRLPGRGGRPSIIRFDEAEVAAWVAAFRHGAVPPPAQRKRGRPRGGSGLSA